MNMNVNLSKHASYYMKKSFLITLIILITSSFVFAQKQTLSFTNSNKIDEKRYQGIKGSPYLFENWMTARLIDNEDSVYNDIEINYNGYTSDFEVKNKSEFITLDDRHFKYVNIESKKGAVLFEKNLHPKFVDQFFLVVYKSDLITCFMDFSVGLSENTINGNMGATTIIKRFKTDLRHHFIIDGKLQSLRISKSKLGLILDNRKAITTFIKKNKLDISTSFDLAKVLTYYENELL